MIAGKYFLLLSAIVISFSSWSQKTKSQLQRERQENLEKIKETEKILTETATEKKNSLGELRALNKRIEQQEVLMTGIAAEIELLDLDIQENNQIINALESDVEKLKEEYAAMVFSAQKATGKIDKLTFLFSASSFDQFMMRLKYMEQYGKARQEQGEAIVRAQSVLADQVTQIETQKEEKQSLLDEEKKESEQLTGLKKKKNTLVVSLEKEEKRLRRELAETKKALAELENMIAKLIKEEMERAAAEARRLRELKAKTNKKAEEVKEEEDAAANIALSASFEENKSKFPWPTSGFVSQRFGKQMHPVLRGIEIQNNGINIQTKQGEIVKTIFSGEIKRVSFVAGLGTAVIVGHGEFFTVYAGLKDITVKTGQKVGTNTEIGKVIATSEGISELRFQIFKNTTPLDPQQWLRN